MWLIFYTIWNNSLCKLKCAMKCEDKCFSWIWYHWEGIAHLWYILSVNFLASKTTVLWILWETSPSHPSSSHITSAKRQGIKNSDSLAKVKVPINSIATKSKPLRSVHCGGEILILWYIWKVSKETKRFYRVTFMNTWAFPVDPQISEGWTKWLTVVSWCYRCSLI